MKSIDFIEFYGGGAILSRHRARAPETSSG